MLRRHFVIAAAAIGLVRPEALGAQSRRLSAAEVVDLLTGNTAVAFWDGKRYASYFGADGVTIYAPEDEEAQIGKWRVDPQTGAYESFWDAIGWTSYAVLRTDEGYAWEREGEIHPFDMLEGRQINQ